MLILTRRCGESILIDETIEIKITEISGDKVKIGISAPADKKVLRKELFLTIQENQSAAKGISSDAVKSFLKNLGRER